MSRRRFAALGAAALAAACAPALASPGRAWAASGTVTLKSNENGCVRIFYPVVGGTLIRAEIDDPPIDSTLFDTDRIWIDFAARWKRHPGTGCGLLRATISDADGNSAVVAYWDDAQGKMVWNNGEIVLGGMRFLTPGYLDGGGPHFDFTLWYLDGAPAFPLEVSFEFPPAAVCRVRFVDDHDGVERVVDEFDRYYEEEIGAAPAAAWRGYRLDGWVCYRSGRETVFSSTTMPWYCGEHNAEPYDFRAVWKPKWYEVGYDLAGGTLNGWERVPSRLGIGFYDEGILPEGSEEPVRDGCAFLGWSWQGRVVTSQDSLDALLDDDSLGEIQLVALWEEEGPEEEPGKQPPAEEQPGEQKPGDAGGSGSAAAAPSEKSSEGKGGTSQSGTEGKKLAGTGDPSGAAAVAATAAFAGAGLLAVAARSRTLPGDESGKAAEGGTEDGQG